MDETHQIIRKAEAPECLDHINSITTTSGHHLIAAIKRRQIEIFNAVLGKSTEFPYNLPLKLIIAPPIYLHRCLEAGMDVNEFKRNGETFLELAVRKQKVKHVHRILKHPQTRLTHRATTLIMKNKIMKKFLHLLFSRGLPADPKYILTALKKNDSDLLRGALASLENADKVWGEIAQRLTCPILNDVTADLVQTPQGQLYDRQSLLQWISANHTCPLTRQELYSGDLRQRSEIIPELVDIIKNIISS